MNIATAACRREHPVVRKRLVGRRGLSLVEILISLAIIALLLTATALAFDAAFESYRTNHDLSAVSIAARNVLYQMCSTIRSSWNDPAGGAPTTVSADGTRCTLTDQNGRVIIYAYNDATRQLQVNIDGAASWYTLIDNVYPITDNDPIFTETPPDAPGFAPGTAGRIEIRFKIEQNEVWRTVSAAAVPCNILYR